MRRVVACLVKVGQSRLWAAICYCPPSVSLFSSPPLSYLWLYLPCLVHAQSKSFPMGAGTGVSSMTKMTCLICGTPTSHLRLMVLERLMTQSPSLPLQKPDGSEAPVKGLKPWSRLHQPVHHPCHYAIVRRRKDARTTKFTRRSIVTLRALLAGLSVLTLLMFLDVLPSVDQRNWRSSQNQRVLSSQNPQMSTWTSL
jgi:hypothetical protein